MWCLEVAGACRDRHGISWAEWWLEVTAWVWGASGPLHQHACLSIGAVRVSQCTVALPEVGGGTWLRGDGGQAHVFAPLYFPVTVCATADHSSGLWNDRLQASSVAESRRRRDLWKSPVKFLGFCFRLNTCACVRLTKCLYILKKKAPPNTKSFSWHFRGTIPSTVSLFVTWSMSLQQRSQSLCLVLIDKKSQNFLLLPITEFYYKFQEFLGFYLLINAQMYNLHLIYKEL